MEAEYRGAALLLHDKEEIGIEVHLSGHIEPIDGTYRWAGRIQPDPRVAELAAGRDRAMTLRTAEGYEAAAKLGERDPWGGCRISGTGAPPFPVPTDPGDLDNPESMPH